MNKLKQLKNLLQREILFIIDKNKKRYIFLLGIIIFFIIINLNQMKIYSNNIGEINIGDFFFYLFKGAENSNNISDIEFPTFWFLINLFVIIIIGDNIRSDFKVNGVYLLTRTSRIMFFISKIISIFINVIIYYIIIFSITLVLGILNFKYYKYFNYNMIDFETCKLILMTVILYITTSIAIVSFYSFLNLLVNEKYSILIISIFLILSVYVNNTILLGNNSMIIRQLTWINGDLNGIFKLVFCNSIFAIINCISGIILMNKKDIL